MLQFPKLVVCITGTNGALPNRTSTTLDPEQVAKVLEVALGDEPLRKSLAKAARERARKFTWDRCAAGVADVIRELV